VFDTQRGSFLGVIAGDVDDEVAAADVSPQNTFTVPLSRPTVAALAMLWLAPKLMDDT